MREQSSVFTMFTVAELQPSHCSHQVTLTPLNHVHIVHHGHLVSGPPPHLNMFTLYTAASWARVLTLQRPPHHGTKICRQ